MGKVLGEKLINLYPESVSAHYWYLINLGSWAEIYGTMSAAKEGVAGIMRNVSKRSLNLIQTIVMAVGTLCLERFTLKLLIFHLYYPGQAMTKP